MTAVAAVTVDLDDTLFPQAQWLAGAWRAVADAAAAHGLPGEPLHAALVAIAAEGSDRGGIIDRALLAVDVAGDRAAALVPELVDVFRGFRPERLACFPGAAEGLALLRARVPVACITDGDPRVQHGKITALGLTDAFDHIVISDELDRRFRKPHPAPFRAALHRLGVAAEHAVHVGDRPAKDVVGAGAVGMRAVRVHTGEYAHLPDPVEGPAAPWRTAPTAAEAFALLLELVRPGARAGS